MELYKSKANARSFPKLDGAKRVNKQANRRKEINLDDKAISLDYSKCSTTQLLSVQLVLVEHQYIMLCFYFGCLKFSNCSQIQANSQRSAVHDSLDSSQCMHFQCQPLKNQAICQGTNIVRTPD